MSFLGNIINEFTHSNSGQHHQQQQQQQQQSGGYGGGYESGQNYGQNYSNPQQGGPPQVHPPWRAVWDDRDNRWLYINEQNGERTFEHPGHGNYNNNYGSNNNYNNYNNNNSGYPPPQQQQQQQFYPEEEHRAEKKHGGHGLAYGAMGAAAGLAGGALLMHEGEEVRRDWDRDEDRVENKMGQWGRDVEDAPEDVARWTGEKVRCVLSTVSPLMLCLPSPLLLLLLLLVGGRTCSPPSLTCLLFLFSAGPGCRRYTPRH